MNGAIGVLASRANTARHIRATMIGSIHHFLLSRRNAQNSATMLDRAASPARSNEVCSRRLSSIWAPSMPLELPIVSSRIHDRTTPSPVCRGIAFQVPLQRVTSKRSKDDGRWRHHRKKNGSHGEARHHKANRQSSGDQSHVQRSEPPGRYPAEHSTHGRQAPQTPGRIPCELGAHTEAEDAVAPPDPDPQRREHDDARVTESLQVLLARPPVNGNECQGSIQIEGSEIFVHG